MAKIGYRFNHETLSYDKIHTSFKTKLWGLIIKLVSSASLAFVIFLVISSFVESPKERALKREKEEMVAQYKLLNNELERLDDILKNLEMRDDNLYRIIFESEPIDVSIRRAGSGGVNKYESMKDMGNAELVITTSRKLDELYKAMYVQSKSYDEIETLARNKIDMLASIPAILPLSMKDKKIRVSSSFGYRVHPIYKTVKLHAGMDFAGPIGTPVYATGNGKVVYAQIHKGYGKCLMIDHGFNYKTLYAHMDKFNVKAGKKVKRGDIIGYIGNTGISTGPHLHYEVKKNNIAVDPINYYFNDLTPDEYEQLVHEANNTGQAMD